MAIVSVTIMMTKLCSDVMREMNDCDDVGLRKTFLTKMDDGESLAQITSGIHTDCILNYETVKYFGGEQHEEQRYREAIRNSQALEYKWSSLCSHCIHFLLLLKALFSFL